MTNAIGRMIRVPKVTASSVVMAVNVITPTGRSMMRWAVARQVRPDTTSPTTRRHRGRAVSVVPGVGATSARVVSAAAVDMPRR